MTTSQARYRRAIDTLAAPPRPPLTRLLVASVVDPYAWRRILYLVLALPLGTTYFVVLVTGLSVGLGVAIITFGLPIVLTFAVARGFARFERRVAGGLLGLDLPDPYRPAVGGWWARLLSRIADPATWKDLAYLIIDFPLGVADFCVAVCVIGVTFGLIAAPFYYWSIPGGLDLGLLRVDTLAEALGTMLVGVALAPLAVRLTSAFATIHALVARALLTASPDPELSARVVDLRSSRARLVAAADAERRRLERDLHDGAQQRLVAMALQLRMARDRLARGDDALELVASAGDEAQKAIAELRDLARGIHPAVLTERGLEPALEDLARRAPLPVEVLESPTERFPAPVEATIYFVVSESLANVAKYAQATHATVTARCEHGSVLVEVADDGAGGAQVGAGSGLRGLVDRVGAMDGELTVDSPPGQGTRVRASVPADAVDERLAEEEDDVADAPAAIVSDVLDERTAAIVRLRRRRRLATHAAVFGVVQLSLIVIWAATGMGYFWPGWAIFGWGVVLALHASLVIVRTPISESAVAREEQA
jgi:signal transduction histidine kinase